MAKKVFATNQKELAMQRAAEEKAKQEAEEAERIAAKQAYMEDLRKQEQKTRSVINMWRAQATAKEKMQRVKMLANVWRRGTKEARIMGPYSVPRTLPEAKQLFAELRQTPKGAVVAFLLALFRKSVDRRIGNVMLAHALHGDCIEGESIVRKFTLKMTAKIDSQILGSYALAANPMNGYSYDPNNLKFEFDNLHTARPFNPQEGDVAHVFLVTNGPLPTYPTSRPVEVKFSDGRWGVRSFVKLTTMVQPSVNVVHSSLMGSDGRMRRMSEVDTEGADIETLQADSTYQPVRRGDNESWTAPIDFNAAKRRAEARGHVETKEEHDKRQTHAKDEVQSLAGRLSLRDIKQTWEGTDPNASRRIVDGHGRASQVTLKDLEAKLGSPEVPDDEDPEKLEKAAQEQAERDAQMAKLREEEEGKPINEDGEVIID